MLIAKNLVKEFEKNEKHNRKVMFRAVDDVSITLEQGEIVGILGPNGAGKTTLLRMLGNLMQPTGGEVFIGDGEQRLSDERQIKRCIGYLSGNTKLYGRLSTRELLQIMGDIYGMERRETETRIEEIAKVLHMEQFIDNRIEKLSTGQTQRASISRCLIHSPSIYIFDEPTLGLDILSSNAIIDFMKRERKNGKAILYSTHYMEEAEQLCDRIILLASGKVIAQGTLEDLKEQTGGENLREVFRTLVDEEYEQDEKQDN
ncbi:MAG: ATP-binding cassette domain-containing protein [Eubacteriales bacterium]|nr:ATP-binding cassette domain-containing protein [Eubacteriales bacterium]